MEEQNNWKEEWIDACNKETDEMKGLYGTQRNGVSISFQRMGESFISSILSSQAYALKEQMKEKDHAIALMYQCLEDVVSQYGGDCISTSEHAEWLVEKFKHLSAIESIEI